MASLIRILYIMEIKNNKRIHILSKGAWAGLGLSTRGALGGEGCSCRVIFNEFYKNR